MELNVCHTSAYNDSGSAAGHQLKCDVCNARYGKIRITPYSSLKLWHTWVGQQPDICDWWSHR